MKNPSFKDVEKKKLLEWSDEYKIGIDEIDNQHKTLFSIANELNNAMLERRSTEILDKLLNDLVNYTQTHFKTEEDFFRLYEYPKTREHIKMHEYLIREVGKLKEDQKNKKFGLSIDLLKFLKDWLTQHIMVNDKEYGIYLKSKGVR